MGIIYHARDRRMTSCLVLLPTISGELVCVGAKAEGDTVVPDGRSLREGLGSDRAA